MKKVKLPNLITLSCGGIGSLWIANIINLGFNPIAIMIFLLIPVFILNYLYPESGLELLYEQPASIEIDHTNEEDTLSPTPSSND